MKAVTPRGIQCPKCGVPQPTVDVVQVDHSGEKGVRFDCCGTVVTVAAMSDVFGIDLPPL